MLYKYPGDKVNVRSFRDKKIYSLDYLVVENENIDDALDDGWFLKPDEAIFAENSEDISPELLEIINKIDEIKGNGAVGRLKVMASEYGIELEASGYNAVKSEFIEKLKANYGVDQG